MDKEVSLCIENTCLRNLQELWQKCIESFTSTSQVIPENSDYGDKEVQRHFEGKVMPDVSVPGAEEEQGILLEIVDEYNQKLRNAPENVVICQRRESRFWNVFFCNNSAFSKQNLRVIFAGEGAAADGGPFREFLRLAMNNIPKLSGLVFGKETEILFISNPVYIQKNNIILLDNCVLSRC